MAVRTKNSSLTLTPAQELELSRQIHHAMVPQALPSVKGIDCASLFLPCNSVGGDLFDVIQISEDIVAFYILDVSRLGFSSVLIATMMKNIFATHIRIVDSPALVLKRANEAIKEISSDFYITTVVGFLDLHVNKLTYCNAGHPSPIIYRKKEHSLQSLDAHDAFLGRYNPQEFRTSSINLFPGDWIVLFTDGMYGFLGDGDAIVGRKLLESSILQTKGTPAAVLLQQFRGQYGRRRESWHQDDDITALTLEILSESRKEQIKELLGFSKDDPVYLQYISYYEEMDRTASTILKEMDTAGFSDESIRRMKITLTELCANAIGHGNHEDHAKKVIVGHLVDRTCVSVSVMDEGEGYDPSLVKDPTLAENLTSDHGRGLFIVRNYVNELSLNTSGNRVLIRKNRLDQSPPGNRGSENSRA
jgi:anti-sigma regulatory factor (Ser/Thr protein kinase)